MGDLNTLHLFSESIFYNQTVLLLKGKKGDMEKYYHDFLGYHINGGIETLSKSEVNILCKKAIEEIISISNKFDYAFILNKDFMIDDSEERKAYLGKYNFFYDFNQFFQYIIFSTCADYFPFFQLGNQSLSRRIQMKNRSIGFEVISKLSMRSDYNLFCCDGEGIVGWVSSEEAQLLKDDFSSLQIENELAINFKKFLDIAVENKLGFLTGVNLNETMLKLLKSYKLQEEKVWMGNHIDELILK